MSSRVVRPALLAGLGAWLAAVLVIAATRDAAGRPGLGGFACTPDLILDGHLWTLLTSAIPVSRYPFAEIAGLALAIYGVLRVSGVVAVWVVGLTAHIGCTVLVYSGIGALWLLDRSAADPYTDRRDYGISAIWLGELGYLTAALWRRNSRLAVGIGCTSLAGSAAVMPSVGPMVTAEHLLALVIGGLVSVALPGLQGAA